MTAFKLDSAMVSDLFNELYDQQSLKYYQLFTGKSFDTWPRKHINHLFLYFS